MRLALDAPPAAVTLFPDQARVTRAGAADLPAGDAVLIVSDLPAGLVADSLTASGRAAGGAGVSIGAVELRPASFDPANANRRRAEIEARIRETDDAIAAVDVRLAALAAQQALIERLAGGFAEAQRHRPKPGDAASSSGSAAAPRLAEDPATWRAAWAAVREGTEEAAEGMRRARLERRTLEERKAELQARLATAGARPARGTMEIAVSVRAEAPTRLELALTYQVPNASWRPVYEARLDSATGRVALRQEAIVVQRTGEDWRDVALTLSTARPTAGTQPPQLAVWRIALVDPAALARQERLRALPAAPPSASAPAGPAAPADGAAAPPPPPREAEAVAASVASAGLAIEYAIPGTATLRSDGTERRVRIGDLAAEAVLSARAVPRLDRRAFLEARFPNPSRAPTLAGQVALYLDGVFVGRATLPLLRPEEEATLAFGPDDRIRVTYEPQEQRRAATGSVFSGRTTTHTREALITVKSFHERPIEITVLDQAPVSTDEQLSVAIAADPPPSARDVDDKPGVLAWTATYAPGEERRIRFGYTVTAPRDRVVTGMPR